MDFECTPEEIERVTTHDGNHVKHIWENQVDKGDFGEVLARLMFEKRYRWENAPEKLYQFVRPRGGFRFIDGGQRECLPTDRG